MASPEIKAQVNKSGKGPLGRVLIRLSRTTLYEVPVWPMRVDDELALRLGDAEPVKDGKRSKVYVKGAAKPIPEIPELLAVLDDIMDAADTLMKSEAPTLEQPKPEAI